MRRSLAFLSLAAALFVATPVLAEDAPKTKKIANLEYDNWAKFAVGAFVETTTVSDSMGNKTTTTMTTKMVELTKEKLVLESQIGMEGVPADTLKPTRRDVPKEIEVPASSLTEEKPQYQPKQGEETLDVLGTPFKCKWHEQTFEGNGVTQVSKQWFSEDLPGRLVKAEQKADGKMGDVPFTSTSKTTVTKWSAK